MTKTTALVRRDRDSETELVGLSHLGRLEKPAPTFSGSSKNKKRVNFVSDEKKDSERNRKSSGNVISGIRDLLEKKPEEK